MLNPYTIAGTVLVIVALAGGWRAWLHQYRADVSDTDTTLRAAGHVPPETDPERTLMIPTVRAIPTVAYGLHSKGLESMRLVPYRGKHHARIGCVTVASLVARLGVPA